MNTIRIEVTTSPLPPITGAALRAAQAAEQEAQTRIATLRAATARLEAVLNSPTIDATMLAEGFGAFAVWDAAWKDTGKIVKRRKVRAFPGTGAWGLPGADSYPGQWPDEALRRAADSYRTVLVNAGVPCPEAGLYTAEYWRDAAARGC